MSIRGIRTTSYTAAHHTVAGRLSARLSDGTYVSMVFDVSGSTPQILIFTSPTTDSAWTLRVTVAANSGTTALPKAQTFGAMCVDDSDNIHVVGSNWSTASQTKPGVSYWKLTKGAGLSWTASGGTTINPPNFFDTGSVGVDIDFVGAGSNGRAIVAVSGVSATTAYCIYYLMNGTTAVLLSTPGTTALTGAGNLAAYSGIRSAAISGRHLNEADNTLTFVYVYLTGNGAVAYGIANVNNTGTSITGYAMGARAGGSQIKMSWSADREVIITTWTTGAKFYLERYTWNSSFVVGTPSLNYFAIPSGDSCVARSWTVFAITRDLVGIFYPSADASGVAVAYVDISIGLAISAGMIYENASNLAASLRPLSVASISGNFNRGIERGQIDPMPIVDYTPKSAPTQPRYASVGLRNAIVPSGLVPAANATVNTDVPALVANVALDSNGNQSDYEIKWQFATDPAFTAPIVTTKQWITGGGSAKKTLETINKLTAQGLWYFRAKTIDRYGQGSAYSATQQFTNIHLPVALPLSPINQVIPWNGGVIAFDWDFSDTSAPATQSAYEVVVSAVADGSVVVDTGMVTGVVSGATATLPGTAKDVDLQWSVTLWDDQGVQGPASIPVGFVASDPPVPVIDNPTSGGVVTGGILTVTWDSGLAGIKTQDRYRLVLQEGANIVHDSGTLSGDDNSYAIPSGLIHTGHVYSLSLTVWDSLNLVGSVSVGFSVLFTLPAPASGVEVFTYNFETRGFIWIGWTNASIDDDFIKWNVYRRKQGDSEWTLLESVYQNQAVYGVSDYEAVAQVQYEYAVTQVINYQGTGDIIESDYSGVVVTTLQNSYYWIIDPAKTRQPIPIYQVTSDSFVDEWERATYTIIARGRHTDVGEHLGVNGSITTQARDHSIGTSGVISNCFADPAFQDNLPFSPEWVFTFAHAGSVIGVAPLECAPSGHEQVIRVDTAGTSATATATQTMPVAIVAAPADKFSLSVYLSDLLSAYAFRVSFIVSWLDHSGATLASQTIVAGITEDWQGNTNWIRYGAQGFCNVSNADRANMSGIAKVQMVIADTGGSGLSLLVNAAMASNGDYQAYGDADSPGWKWDGAAYVSASYTNGFYTARDQRLDIVELISLSLPKLKLRTPFGDIWNVALQDISFSRLAGVGSQAEYGDITIPYLEQAD